LRRLHITAEQVANRHNLWLALRNACKGKRQRPYVQRYLAAVDDHLNRLATRIMAGDMPHGHFQTFIIHDPKQRQIDAACFEDRVFHHALMNIADPVFECSQTDVSYACRPGRGHHAAAQRVYELLRRPHNLWYVQIDIVHYFSAIRHQILLDLLQRKFKGAWLTQTWQNIVAAWAHQPGVGLPIGTLTSQYFANHYLSGFDRFLTEQLHTGPAVRYMDDVIWFAPDRISARHSLRQAQAWLKTERGLNIKPQWCVNRTEHGVAFCGHRITAQQIRLSRRRQRRYTQLSRMAEQAYENDELTVDELQQRMAAIHAITLPAHSTAWRRESLRRNGSLDV